MLEPALLALALVLGDYEEPPPAEKLSTVALDDYQFAQVQRVDVSDGRTKVSVENNAPSPLAGTFPVRVFIDNSLGPAGPVELSFRANAQGFHLVRRTVELRAGERRVVDLPAFAEMRYGTVSASGAGTRPGAGSVYFQSVTSPNKVVLTLSRPETFEHFIGKAPNYAGGSVQVLAIPVDEAPAELASYAGYDAVILPEAGTLEALDEGPLRALEAYAATGGALIIEGPLRSNKTLPLLARTNAGWHPYAFGQVTIHEGQGLDPASLRQEFPVNPHGPVPEYERRYGTARLDALLPQATAPLGRFLLIILVFTVLIGPGSLLVARRRGAAALLVTIPLTAFLTCAAIIGYSLAADGFTVHASSYGLTWLDAKAHRAINLGVTGYYANLSPPNAVFPAMTVVVPAHEERREHFSADLSWSEGLTLGSDFIPSRVYREWGLLSVEPTRARLVVKQQAGAWVVQNALGHELRSLLVNVDGKQLRTGALRDGGEAVLELAAAGASLNVKLDRFSSQAVPKVGTLPPGQFLAELTGTGFLPTGGVVTQLHDGQHWVRGTFEP